MLTVLLVAAVPVLVVLAAVALPLVALRARHRGPVRPLSTLVVVGLGVASQDPLGLAAGVVAAGWLQWDGRRRRHRRALRAAARHTARAERLTRPWAAPVRRALAAARRYDGAVAALSDGPLRDRLASLAPEVERTTAEVRRLAASGQRAQREAALVTAGARRAARAGAGDPSLAKAVAAQQAVGARLAVAAAEQRARLERLCAHLELLAAEAAEVVTLTAEPAWQRLGAPVAHAPPPPGEELAAVRAALADVAAFAAAPGR